MEGTIGINDAVRHTTFGCGVVLKCNQNGSDRFLVRFADAERVMLPSFLVKAGHTSTTLALLPKVKSIKITYSAEFLQLWQEAKSENKLRAQRLDLESAMSQAYQENLRYDRGEWRAAKRAAVQWLISDTTESRTRLFEHIKAAGALAIEPTPESLAGVSDWYTSLCGECFPEGSESVFIVFPKLHSRSTEYRVTFPLPEFELPAEFNYQTMFSGGPGRLAINSKELFAVMVKEGMRL